MFFNRYDFQLSDTSSARLRGFNIGINYGLDIFKSRRIDLIPMIGFGYQQAKFRIDIVDKESGYEGINKEIKYVC